MANNTTQKKLISWTFFLSLAFVVVSIVVYSFEDEGATGSAAVKICYDRPHKECNRTLVASISMTSISTEDRDGTITGSSTDGIHFKISWQNIDGNPAHVGSGNILCPTAGIFPCGGKYWLASEPSRSLRISFDEM